MLWCHPRKEGPKYCHSSLSVSLSLSSSAFTRCRTRHIISPMVTKDWSWPLSMVMEAGHVYCVSVFSFACFVRVCKMKLVWLLVDPSYSAPSFRNIVDKIQGMSPPPSKACFAIIFNFSFILFISQSSGGEPWIILPHYSLCVVLCFTCTNQALSNVDLVLVSKTPCIRWNNAWRVGRGVVFNCFCLL